MQNKKYLPFSELKPGQKFWFKDFNHNYMKVHGVTTISKGGINVVNLDNGELHYLELETAVIVDNQ